VIVFDNGCYKSIGGAPTATAAGTDLAMVARGCGIKDSMTVSDGSAFRTAAKRALEEPGPIFVVARIERLIAKVKPKTTDIFEDKYRFVRYSRKPKGSRFSAPPGGVGVTRTIGTQQRKAGDATSRVEEAATQVFTMSSRNGSFGRAVSLSSKAPQPRQTNRRNSVSAGSPVAPSCARTSVGISLTIDAGLQG
jgi:hypothetical protein